MSNDKDCIVGVSMSIWDTNGNESASESESEQVDEMEKRRECVSEWVSE